MYIHPHGVKMLLAEHQIPWEDTWGIVPGSKPLAELQKEIELGETLLRRYLDVSLGSILKRKNHTLLLRIFSGEPRKMLIEYKRNKEGLWVARIPRGVHVASVAEKMRWFKRKREKVVAACLRAMLEELGLVISPEELLATLVTLEEPPPPEFGPSTRFPGLYTENTFELVSWTMLRENIPRYFLERQLDVLTSIFLWWDTQSELTLPKVEEVVPPELLAA